MFTPSLNPQVSDIWNCRNRSELHYNMDHMFPNKVLPVLDHTLSLLGAGIISLLLLIIYIRYKILRYVPLSSFLLMNVCLAQLLASFESILLYLSSRAPLHSCITPSGTHYYNGTNIYTFAAVGVENTFRVVRVCSFLLIYLVRLLSETAPCWLLLHRQLLLSLERWFCLCVWVVGVGIGGFRTFLRLRIMAAFFGQKEKSIALYKDLDFSSLAIFEFLHLVGVLVSLATVLYLTGFLLKYRPTRIAGPGSEPSPDRYFIYRSVKSCLLTLVLLFLIDLIFDINHTLHYVVSMKQLASPGCYPEFWIKMRNYFGSPTNYMYSHHSPDVLNGICTALVFLFQKSLKETARLFWNGIIRSVRSMVASLFSRGLRQLSYGSL